MSIGNFGKVQRLPVQEPDKQTSRRGNDVVDDDDWMTNLTNNIQHIGHIQVHQRCIDTSIR